MRGGSTARSTIEATIARSVPIHGLLEIGKPAHDPARIVLSPVLIEGDGDKPHPVGNLSAGTVRSASGNPPWPCAHAVSVAAAASSITTTERNSGIEQQHELHRRTVSRGREVQRVYEHKVCNDAPEYRVSTEIAPAHVNAG